MALRGVNELFHDFALVFQNFLHRPFQLVSTFFQMD